MGLLDRFKKLGTILDNDKIIKYDGKTKINPNSFISKLDLDGTTPKKYLDFPPK